MKYIHGVASTPFQKSHKPSAILLYEAATAALADARKNAGDIDAWFVSGLDLASGMERQRHHAARLRSLIPTDKPIYQVPAACAGGGSAFHAAMNTAYDTVAVVGVDRLSSVPAGVVQEEYLLAADQWWEQPQGMIFPAQAALIAKLYDQKYGSSRAALTQIAFKNHEYGRQNPLAASYGKKITVQEIEGSPIICSPLRKFDCAMTVDGAAAVIISNDKADVRCEASVQMHDTLTFWERGDYPHFPATQKAWKQLQDKTGINHKEIDMYELHDAFTIMELIAYEDVGLAKAGKGCEMSESLQRKINLSGGLKAKGHPVSATGVGQIVDIAKQIRGEATGVQADNMGGMGSTLVLTMLKRT